MNKIVLLVSTLFCVNVFAEKCPDVSGIDSSPLEIKRDSDLSSNIYHVRAPSSVGVHELSSLILTGTIKGQKIDKVLSVPLAIKRKDGISGSYFHMVPEFLAVKVVASYGKEKCKVYEAEFNM